MSSTTGQTQFYQIKGFNYGWICPKCGKVYSPTYPECYSCNEKEITFSSSSVCEEVFSDGCRCEASRDATKNNK